MTIDILNKIFFILFFLASLNVLRTAFFFIGSFVKSGDEISEKFRLTTRQLFLFGLSIAYILSTLFTGIKIML